MNALGDIAAEQHKDQPKDGLTPGMVMLLLIWLAVILFALYQFSLSRLVNFDPKGILVTKASSLQFERLVETLTLEQETSIAQMVVHFRQDNCTCKNIAHSHIDSVKQLAVKNSYRNVNISVDDKKAWQQFVPSTPAIAVFDKQGKLSYFGPYSSGYYCTAGNGLVEPFIGETNAPAATIVSDSRGCYCSTS